MLKLILGRQKTGKTEICLNTVKTAVECGEQVILLVPEQSNFAMQKLTLEELGSKISNKVEIHSFISLCEAICSVYGGVSGTRVDDGIRFMLVREAVKLSRDNLKLFAKYTESTPFIKQMMSAITELKQSKISSEKLQQIINVSDGVFADKLHDISLVLSTYNSLLQNVFIDPMDIIEHTVSRMSDNSFFNNKTVVIDDFKGFTATQFSLLERIIAGSKNVYVTLCTDRLKSDSDTDVFANVTDCAESLYRIAQNHLVSVDKPLILNSIYSENDDIVALDSFLSEKNDIRYTDSIPMPNIIVCEADTTADEIEFCFNNIRHLVRENGYRYRDFVIISRNESGYSEIINDISASFDIPVLVDNRISVLNLPLSVFILKAVKSVINFKSENILSFVKTGLTGLSEDDINNLENYIYIWNIEGNKWLQEWTMSTQGLNPDLRTDKKIQEEAERLRVINEIKSRVIKPLQKLKNSLNGTVEDMCRALLHLCDDFSTLELLSYYTEKLEAKGKFQEAEYQRAGYDILIKVFDKINAVFGQRKISADEFAEILSVSLSYETVGEIPQTQDQVIFGTADRIRPMRPKVAFVIGVNQDVFPAALADVGLFTQTDREVLNSNNLKISDRHISDCIDEKFLFYFALTCADEKVFVSYSKTNSMGSALEPSIEVAALQKAFSSIVTIKYGRDFNIENIETKEATFRKLAEHFNDDNEDINGLKAYFSLDSEYKARFSALQDYIKQREIAISLKSAEKIYGDVIQLSPSKADDFSGCKFQYFCKYGLGAGKLEKAEFNPLTRGNVVHFGLEHFVINHLNDIGTLNDSDIKAEIEFLCEQYLKNNNTNKTDLDEKFLYLFNVVVETTVYLAQCLNREFSVSLYKPKYCELSIGDGEAVTGIDVLTDNGKRVTMRGKVDRVDTAPGGKVRVVDYKTGSKGDGLKISELIDGQNMQMLLYLYALLKNGQDLIQADTPTAVLYFPAKREFGDSQSEFVKMHGIIVEDPDIVKEMEPTGKGKIAPVTLFPNGTSFYKSESLVPDTAFDLLFKYIELLLKKIGNSLTKGDIAPGPLIKGDKLQCEFCDYRSICRADVYDISRESTDCKRDEAFETMRKELEEQGNVV